MQKIESNRRIDVFRPPLVSFFKPDSDIFAPELHHYTRELTRIALDTIDEQHGSGRKDKREQKLFFHSRWHTESVIWRVEQIMLAMHRIDPTLITERDIEIAKLAAAYHDVIQHSRSEQQKPDASGMSPKKRVRDAGRNERESAELGLTYMHRVNQIVLGQGRKEIYTQKDMDNFKDAVILTDPSCKGTDPRNGWNGQTIAVRDFAKGCILAQAVQLADLGASGMQPYLEDYSSLALFTEENMDFREEMDTLLFPGLRRRHLPPREMQDQEKRRAWYYQRLMKWFGDQDSFIDGRYEAVKHEISALNVPPEFKTAVAALFPEENFIRSRKAEAGLAAQYAEMPNFKDWALDINDRLVAVPQLNEVNMRS